jgi:hypothetical protein
LANQIASSLVGLGASRDVLHLLRVDEPDDEPGALEQVEEGPPIVRGRLQDDAVDAVDALDDEIVGVLADRLGRRAHLPHLGCPSAGDAWVRDPGADHAGRLGDVDRSDTFYDLVLLVHLELLGSVHCCSSSLG